jgi:hypothetical protein
MSDQQRYKAFRTELRDLLRRYDAEIGMRYGGYGDSRFGYERGPDVLEVQFGWGDTHELPSCINKESH